MHSLSVWPLFLNPKHLTCAVQLMESFLLLLIRVNANGILMSSFCDLQLCLLSCLHHHHRTHFLSFSQTLHPSTFFISPPCHTRILSCFARAYLSRFSFTYSLLSQYHLQILLSMETSVRLHLSVCPS